MINKNFNKRCFAHVHLLNVTMSRCHDVTMSCLIVALSESGVEKLHRRRCLPRLKECLPRVKGMPSTGDGRHLLIGMEGIGTTHARHRNTSKRPATPV